MRKFALIAIVSLAPSLSAQWLDFRTPGIPRTADGKPNLMAPAPRTPDGKPDLSGLWRPVANPYALDVIQDLKDEAVFQPAAEALFLDRVADYRRQSPVTHCLPGGPLVVFGFGGNQLYRIIQTPAMVALLYEGGPYYRQIFMDGRELPKDPNPTWMGYSVGHWEADTLVVESAGFNDRTWLDMTGHPHSEDLRVTERIRRVDFGHIQFQITFTDPKTLVKPLTISLAVDYTPDTDMIENVCSENERDTAHLVAKANSGVQLSPAVLGKYAGKYEFRDGSLEGARFFGLAQTLTVMNGRLWLNATPLIPQSETRFESAANPIEFFMDRNGAVTHFILSGAEGDTRYDRKP